MKRFNWKAAIITFTSLLAIAGVSLLLDRMCKDNAVITAFTQVILLYIMLPGTPVFVLFPVSMAAGDDYTWDYFLFTIASGIGASVWSMLVGFFTRRAASQQPTEVE